jgi:hypothetical protein
MRRILSSLVPSPAMTVALAALLAACSGLAVAATSSSPVIRACANKKTGALRLASKCRRSERSVSWNQTGLTGAAGLTGAPGATGKEGSPGKEGKAGPAGPTNVTVREGKLESIPAGKIGIVTASCNPGEKATGWGSSISGSDSEWTISESFPTPSSGTPTGWQVRAFNHGAGANNLVAFVICVS